jgi:hypothetical protein
MKPKLILGLALVLSGGLIGCSTNWRAKAAKVTVGMTRGQVEKILPMWSNPNSQMQRPEVAMVTGGGQECLYWVSENWRVAVNYDYTGGEYNTSNRVVSLVEVNEEKFPYTNVVFNFKP